ncbi:MAG: hypothetical protein P9M03_02675 [Candidatus Theseobacter exili]|nr:hypothetical protein [Candidatus Theseobacter exili]
MRRHRQTLLDLLSLNGEINKGIAHRETYKLATVLHRSSGSARHRLELMNIGDAFVERWKRFRGFHSNMFRNESSLLSDKT